MENVNGKIIDYIRAFSRFLFLRDPKNIYLKIKNSIVKVIYFSWNEVRERKKKKKIFYFFFSDKLIGTTAITKYYCQYRKDIHLFRMINFTQTSTKQVCLRVCIFACMIFKERFLFQCIMVFFFKKGNIFF